MLLPLLVIAALAGPGPASAHDAAAQVSRVLVVDSIVCDAASTTGHFQAAASQINNVSHGAATACAAMQTDADSTHTFSIATVDGGGASVYTSGPFNSRAPAGVGLYILTAPRMTYHNDTTTTWPDGTYTTSVTLDGAAAGSAVWTVGAPAPTAVPPTATATPGAPGAEGTVPRPPVVPPAISTPVVIGKPAAPVFHVRAGAPYTLRPLGPYPGMRGPLLGVAIDSAGNVLAYTSLRTVNQSSGGAVFENHVYVISAAGKARALASPQGATDLEPHAMNDKGEAVAYSYANSEGFVYRAGAWHTIADGIDATPLAIDNAGHITGFAALNDGSYAFLASDSGGPAKALGTLPCGCATKGEAFGPNGIIYGYSLDRTGYDAAVAFPPNGGPAIRLLPAPSLASNHASAASAAGVVGGTAILPDAIHITRYKSAQHDLGAIPGWRDGAVTGVDKVGRVAGYVSRIEHGLDASRAFVADDGGPHDLTTLAGLGTGAVIQQAVAENNGGVILANAQLGPALMPVVLVPSRHASNPLPGKLAGFPPVPRAASMPVAVSASGAKTYACPYFGYKITFPTTWGILANGTNETFCDSLAPKNNVSPQFANPGQPITGYAHIAVHRNQPSLQTALTSAFQALSGGESFSDIVFANGQHPTAGAPLPTGTTGTPFASWTTVTYTIGNDPTINNHVLLAAYRRPDGYTWVFAIEVATRPASADQAGPLAEAMKILASFQPIGGSPYETARTQPGNVPDAW